jgi:hypothetical protein
MNIKGERREGIGEERESTKSSCVLHASRMKVIREDASRRGCWTSSSSTVPQRSFIIPTIDKVYIKNRREREGRGERGRGRGGRRDSTLHAHHTHHRHSSHHSWRS